MKTRLRSRDRISFLLGLSFLLITILACNPVARFTKQYKCTVQDKPEPKTPYEYVNRGVEHMNAGELDCAMGACSEAIRLDSRFAAGYACRGSVLNGKDEYSKALKDYDYALSLQTENGDFYYNRAAVHDHLGNTDQALADLAKAIELISSEAGRSFALSRRAQIYQKRGKLAEAVADNTEAIRLKPEFAYHHKNRGDVYVETGDYNKAIGDYSEAIKLDPKNEHFYSVRAEAYRALGREDLADRDELIVQSLKAGGTPEQTWVAEPPSSKTKVISGGILNTKAISLPQPPYPPIARAAKAAGRVVVQVVIDENGKIISAHAVSGHPLLQAACVAAARQATFAPTILSGQPVKVKGLLTYDF